jgi:Tol biopolymer transport system component
LSLAAGTRLGPYEIVAPIGAGGMGEVYKAKDTRLERTVAVKVLPQHLSASPEVRQRFEREAKTISQLSHSNICALYDVGNADGTEYLVMELLEGETLSDRLAKGSLPLEQTLRFGTQIADALDKAHRQGIVHRDLKPGNVMITKSGVKLLDFGLAKAMTAPAPTSGLTSLPTMMGTANNLTQEGTILGTFQYMAPEQLEGRDADGRTDIFSFGCVLYEMATGRKAFSGATQASLISSIMKEEPAPISSVTPMTPPALDRVVRRCLAKDPEDRWQNAGDLGSELKWIAEGGSQTGIAAPIAASGRRRSSWPPWAAALVLAVLGFAGGMVLRKPAPQTVMRTTMVLPPKTSSDGANNPIAVSPDGSRVALAATGAEGKMRIWMRSMDGLEMTPMVGTEGATLPFWSPDGRFIGFFADHKLKKIPSAGGSVLTICDAADGRGASWGAGDVIVFSPGPFSPLFRVSAAGGAPVAVTEVPQKAGSTHRLPYFLPDGRHLLFFAGGSKTIDKENTIAVLDLETRKVTTLAHENSEGRYAEPGYLLFYRDGNLMAQPFDARALKLSGEAVPIAEKVQFSTFRYTAAFGTSRSGLLVYQSGVQQQKKTLTWFDLDGKNLGKVGEPSIIVPLVPLALSPDGTRAAVMIQAAGGPSSVWIYDLVRGVANPLTSSSGTDSSFGPLWSPDGKQIAYGTTEGMLIVRAADGSSEPKTIVAQTPNLLATSWSGDGKSIAFRVQNPKTGSLDIWIVPADGSGPPRPFLATPAEENGARFSPSGRWLSFTSDESGRREVYVVPYPGPGEKRQISTLGAEVGWWLGEGELVYRQPPENKWYAVSFEEEGDSFRLGSPRVLFGDHALPQGPLAFTKDGKRVLVGATPDEDALAQLTVVTNWASELKR